MSDRRKYSQEFKLDAINLVQEQGYSRAEASRSLSINANMLSRWIKEYEAAQERTRTVKPRLVSYYKFC